MAARFSIGIDLGTTNSALAYVPLTGDAHPEALAVSQWESPAALTEATTLPSFLYLPEDGRAVESPGQRFGNRGMDCRPPRPPQGGRNAGRVVRSAKSWLCHHSADRSAPILPWGSEDLQPAQKISPVRAAALILSHLRGAWNSQFAGSGFAFDSRKSLSRRLPRSTPPRSAFTLDAAEDAGFPAACGCWRSRGPPSIAGWSNTARPSHRGKGSDPHTAEPRRVLIVDIGGGTSDFSLFELRPGASGAIPDIRRVAVSEHILLGGDNIDLALAALLEPRLVAERGRMSGPQWDHLVASCRDLKERALSGTGSAQERYVVALPGRGSSLVAGAQTATLARDEVERLVLDGFSRSAMRAPGLIAPSRVCATGVFPTRPTARSRAAWPISFGTARAWTPSCSTAVRCTPRSCASGCSTRLRPGRAAPARSSWKMPSPILPSRAAPLASASCCTLPPVASRRAPPELCSRGADGSGGDQPSGRVGADLRAAPRWASQQVFEVTCQVLSCKPTSWSRLSGLFLDPSCAVQPETFCPWDATPSTRCRRCRTIVRTAHGDDVGSTSCTVRLAGENDALDFCRSPSCVGTDRERRSPGRSIRSAPARQGGAAARGAPAPAPSRQRHDRGPAGRAGSHRDPVYRPPPKSDRLTANAALKTLERIIRACPAGMEHGAPARSSTPALNERPSTKLRWSAKRFAHVGRLSAAPRVWLCP